MPRKKTTPPAADTAAAADAPAKPKAPAAKKATKPRATVQREAAHGKRRQLVAQRRRRVGR